MFISSSMLAQDDIATIDTISCNEVEVSCTVKGEKVFKTKKE
jgi:hypothetical protein